MLTPRSVTRWTASRLNSRLNFRLVIATLQVQGHLIPVSTNLAAAHPVVPYLALAYPRCPMPIVDRLEPPSALTRPIFCYASGRPRREVPAGNRIGIRDRAWLHRCSSSESLVPTSSSYTRCAASGRPANQPLGAEQFVDRSLCCLFCRTRQIEFGEILPFIFKSERLDATILQLFKHLLLLLRAGEPALRKKPTI
jgi:hypothetical protein